MIESRAVWKDLESRRIEKSLEGVRVRDDVKRHGVIVRECRQTLGLELVDRNRTVVNY